MPTAFSYHRAISPMMWVLVSIACVELVVVHLLVALWSLPAALVLSLLSLATIIWLVGAIRSFRRLPVLLDNGRLVMRAGRLKGIDLPFSSIAGLRADWDAAAIKDRSLLNLALIAWPNIVIDLREPMISGGLAPRRVTAVAHRLDDPAAFAAALKELGAGA